ncbi:hypothetical protein BpHYR1_035470 [Brachionus plicatilis]|uniref:Uncharacterized protein n=1 Tax=Brachionus plicatilis TaxID=10195 RepID=A0A3M7PCI0_BRAPC|nr:hypothetical protein BpHYR1_035470 [Brachionus plicatilis]
MPWQRPRNILNESNKSLLLIEVIGKTAMAWTCTLNEINTDTKKKEHFNGNLKRDSSSRVKAKYRLERKSKVMTLSSTRSEQGKEKKENKLSLRLNGINN